METKKLLESFVESRDNQGKIIAAFGYGSGIFKQAGYTLQKKPMIDTIFIVENPHLWHKENMKKNPSDYSLSGRIALKYFDLNAVKSTTGVTYQSNISFQHSTFKYGIIGKKRFMDSMMGNWEHFFIQGRFQKPIYTIFSNDEIDKAIQENRDLAIYIALLTLKKHKPNILDLYHQICSLSYRGDIRMLFAENPNKVRNIIQGSFDSFIEMYGTENDYFYTKENGELVIDYSLLYGSLALLPDTLYKYLMQKGYSINQPKHIANVLEDKMSKINKRDSIIQPIIGIITVGPIKSISYLSEKIKKKTMKQ